jgi:hypothetical protein
VLPNGKRARYSYQAVAIDDSGKSVQSIEGVLVEISARIEDFMQLRGEHRIADGKLKVPVRHPRTELPHYPKNLGFNRILAEHLRRSAQGTARPLPQAPLAGNSNEL